MDPDDSAEAHRPAPLDGGGREDVAEGASPSGVAAESREREEAVRRGRARIRQVPHGDSHRGPFTGIASPEVAHHAFAALAENVRDYAIFLMNPDGVITFWGEGARLVKGWSKREAEGAHLRLLYPDGGAEDGTAEAHLEESARTGEYTGEGHRVRSDGSTFWGGITLTALRDPQGSLLGFAKVTRDLTARGAEEAARKSAFDAAEEASRLKSLFLATMSHEIRTPLNAIMAYTDLLGMELAGPLTPQHHEQLARIRHSSQHLLGIIDDVLDFSRIESGRLSASRAQLTVGKAVSQALMLVEPQAAGRHVELVDAVSGIAADHRFWGDEERVRQILLNLFTNAIKYSEPGGRITVSAGSALEGPPDGGLQGQGPWVYFRVEDTGPGIPPERMDAIFEPFVQADMSYTRQHGGAGLGLSISRRLALLMGGDLTVRSEVGIGSTFFLWLPAAPEEEPAPATRSLDASHLVLNDIGEAILADLERILHAYVARLRSDPATPGAQSLSEAELENHLASFLSDVAQTIGILEPSSAPGSDRLADATAIQRTIAERHGLQRARLGWSENEVRREFQILREELAAAVRRRVSRSRQAEVEEALGVIRDAITRAERVSLETLKS